MKVRDKTNDEIVNVVDITSAKEAGIEQCEIAISIFEGAIEEYKNDPEMLSTFKKLIDPWKKRFKELSN